MMSSLLQFVEDGSVERLSSPRSAVYEKRGGVRVWISRTGMAGGPSSAGLRLCEGG